MTKIKCHNKNMDRSCFSY